MKYLEVIEDYLNDQLSVEDRTSFEENCQHNEALAKELAFYIQAQQAIKQKKIANLNERYQVNKARPKSRNIRYLGIATSVAAAVILLIWLGMPLFNDYQTANKFAQNETPIFFLNSQTTRSDETIKDTYKIAFEAITTKDYTTAINIADTLNTNEALAIKGFAYFELKQYSKSLEAYEAYLQTQPKYYERLRATWNLSLAHRFAGNEKEAKRILDEMNDEERADILKVIEE